ncbi:Kelch repeat-containing protein [Paenibacillus sp. BAC0078]
MKYLKSVVLVIFLCLVLNPNFASAATATSKPDTWVNKASMPFGIRDFGIAEVSGKIYLFGGYSNNGSGNVYNNKVISYDPASDTWTDVAPMATQNRTPYGGAATVNGKVYVIGSTNGDLRLVEEFDPSTKVWTTKASMPAPNRLYSGVAVVNNKIYVAGGSSASNKLEEYDPVNNTWTTKADIPTPTSAASVVSINGKILVLGGKNQEGKLQKIVNEYDPSTNSWTRKADMPIETQATQATSLYGKVYIMGGASPTDYISSVNEYDPATDKWTSRKNMSTIRFAGGAVAVNGKIYAMGGETPVGQYYPIIEEYTSLQVPSSISLTASGGQQVINLNWTAADGASGYEVKRSTTTGGPYTTIASNVQGTTFADKNVENGKTYYYVVTVNTSSGENGTSNEANATPQGSTTPPTNENGRAILEVTLNNGIQKEFDLSMSEVEAFVRWYEEKASGNGPASFVIDKHSNNKGPFSSRKEYVIFDKILTFSVDEYTAKE